MIITILILSGIVTLIICFRRHGKGKLLQYGNGLKSLPVIEFDDKDEYGDELKAEIDEAYKIWYYGKEQYDVYKKVVDYREALPKFSNRVDSYAVDYGDVGFNRTLDRAINYKLGTTININNGAIYYETAQCSEILDSIERKAKREQGNYHPDRRYIP